MQDVGMVEIGRNWLRGEEGMIGLVASPVGFGWFWHSSFEHGRISMEKVG